MTERIDPASSVVIDVGEDEDPFRTAHPAVLVHDVSEADFARAWNGRANCPQCRQGIPVTRGEAGVDHRRWVRFSCGDVVAVEESAG